MARTERACLGILANAGFHPREIQTNLQAAKGRSLDGPVQHQFRQLFSRPVFYQSTLAGTTGGWVGSAPTGLGFTSCGLTKHLDVSFALSFVLGQRKHPSTTPIAQQAASFVPIRVSQGLLAKEHLLPTQPIGLPHGLGSPTLGNVIFQHACMQRALAKTTPQGPSLASLEQGHRSVRLPQPPFRRQRAMGSPGI